MNKEFDLEVFAAKFRHMMLGDQDEVLKVTSITNLKAKHLDDFIRTTVDNYNLCLYEIPTGFNLVKVMYTNDMTDRMSRIVYDFDNNEVFLIFDIPYGYNLANVTSEFEASLFYNSLALIIKAYDLDKFFEKINLEAALVLCAIKYGMEYTDQSTFDGQKLLNSFSDEVKAIVNEILNEQKRYDSNLVNYNFSTILNIMQNY